jgi:hypothetical protein
MGLAPITRIGACPIFIIQGVARDMTNSPIFMIQGVARDMTNCPIFMIQGAAPPHDQLSKIATHVCGNCMPSTPIAPVPANSTNSHEKHKETQRNTASQNRIIQRCYLRLFVLFVAIPVLDFSAYGRMTSM